MEENVKEDSNMEDNRTVRDDRTEVEKMGQEQDWPLTIEEFNKENCEDWQVLKIAYNH